MSFVYLTGGIHNKRKLISTSQHTRPTSQMVRAAVFNMIAVHGVILDLFAGAGLYGFEAISRGASRCYFNDVDHDAYTSIKHNAHTLKETDKCHIFKLDYRVFLKQHQATHFDFIFIDPPYALTDDDVKTLLVDLKRYQATLILERHKHSISPSIDGLTLIKEKIYGIKKITIYQPSVEA